jgi:cysteine sulfinate desulfinase/cysteine desulfurase-like protein
VLTALGLPYARIRGTVRFGLGRSNTREEIDRAAAQLIGWVRDTREKRAAGAGRPSRE